MGRTVAERCLADDAEVVVVGGGEGDNRSMSFRIVAGAGGTKGSLDVAVADSLLAKIDEIAEIFWETKIQRAAKTNPRDKPPPAANTNRRQVAGEADKLSV